MKTGKVSMLRVADSNNGGVGQKWEVYDPYGDIVDITGTKTNGLQEAINYAQMFGFDLNVPGGGYTSNPGTDVSIIWCQEPLIFAPLEKMAVDVDSVSVMFSPTHVRGNAIIFDSALMATVRWGGQIGYAGDMAAIAFKPTTEIPLSGGKAIVDCKFEFCAVAGYGNIDPDAKIISMDGTDGPITNNIFEFVELNNGAYSLHMDGVGNGVVNNKITIGEAHQATKVGVAVGVSGGYGTTTFGNEISARVEPAAGATGVDVYGKDNLMMLNVSSQEGMPTVGLNLQPSARKNTIISSKLMGTTPFIDNSTTQDNVTIGSGF